MGDTKNEILDAVKLLLGIKDNDKDDVLMLLIEDTVNSVLAYCKLYSDAYGQEICGKSKRRC